MRKIATAVLVLAAIAGWAGGWMPREILAEGRAKVQARSDNRMLETLEKLDAAKALSPEKANALFGTTLKPGANTGNSHLHIFTGSSEAWRAIELRFPVGGDGTRFVLVLEPATPLPMKDVQAKFGSESATDLPSPSVPREKAMIGYVYKRPVGQMRFSFPSFQDFSARTILIDRM